MAFPLLTCLPSGFLKFRKHAQGPSKQGGMALLLSSFPGLYPPQERRMSTYWGWALGCSEGFHPLLWLSDQAHGKGHPGRAEARTGRKDALGKQEIPGPERDGKLDGKEAGGHVGSCQPNSSMYLAFWEHSILIHASPDCYYPE